LIHWFIGSLVHWFIERFDALGKNELLLSDSMSM